MLTLIISIAAQPDEKFPPNSAFKDIPSFQFQKSSKRERRVKRKCPTRLCKSKQKDVGLKAQHAHIYVCTPTCCSVFCSKSTSCWKVKLLKLFELTKRQQRAKWRRRCPRKNWIKTGIKSDKVNLCTTRYKQGCSTKRDRTKRNSWNCRRTVQTENWTPY